MDYKGKNGLGPAHEINDTDWQQVVTDAAVFKDPWPAARPTEADFLQLVADEFGQQQPIAGHAVYDRPRLKVDVLVHQRGLTPLKPANVSVLLLSRLMTGNTTDWPKLAIDPAWKTATVAALTTGGPAGGGPDGWAAVGQPQIGHPAADLSALQPQPVTFDLLATPGAKGDIVGRYVIVAVCSSSTAAITEARLPGATLSDLITQSPHMAAHELTVFFL